MATKKRLSLIYELENFANTYLGKVTKFQVDGLFRFWVLSSLLAWRWKPRMNRVNIIGCFSRTLNLVTWSHWWRHKRIRTGGLGENSANFVCLYSYQSYWDIYASETLLKYIPTCFTYHIQILSLHLIWKWSYRNFCLDTTALFLQYIRKYIIWEMKKCCHVFFYKGNFFNWNLQERYIFNKLKPAM